MNENINIWNIRPIFLYFKYWYFRSLKRFWDCDFNFVNVLESFDLVFHFGFNQNKLWTNWRILDHVSDAYVACVGLFGHLFWSKRSFWQQCQIISCHTQIIGPWPSPKRKPCCIPLIFICIPLFSFWNISVVIQYHTNCNNSYCFFLSVAIYVCAIFSFPIVLYSYI
jgi:hypothetical protein